jgi:hypothetical protein
MEFELILFICTGQCEIEDTFNTFYLFRMYTVILHCTLG